MRFHVSASTRCLSIVMASARVSVPVGGDGVFQGVGTGRTVQVASRIPGHESTKDTAGRISHPRPQKVFWLGHITNPRKKALNSTPLDTCTQATYSCLPCFPSTRRVTVMPTRRSQPTVPSFFLAIQSSKPHHALRTDNANHDRGVMMRSEAPVGIREQPCRCHLPNPSPGCRVIGWRGC